MSLLPTKRRERCVFSLPCLFRDKANSMYAAHLKGSWNGVILFVFFEKSYNNVHGTTAVFPKKNAHPYTYLLRTS